MKRNLSLFAAVVGVLLFGGVACSTTTIQTGGTQHHGERPYNDSSSGDPESRFFSELSEQDEAFAGEAQPIAASGAGCPCESRAPASAVALSSDRDAANSRGAAVTEADSENDGAAANDAGQAGSDSFFSQTTGAAVTPTDNGAVAGVAAVDPARFGDYSQVGLASWYGRDFDGKPTASGEPFNSRKLTAAHRDIPLGSIVLVRNLSNNKEVLVTVNDRGPFVEGRILDVSEYGAELLGYKEQGLTRVGIRVVRVGQGRAGSRGATQAFFGEDREAAPPGPALQADQVRDEMSLARYFSVQVGLFSELKNARSMERFLQSYGQPVHVLRRGDQFVVKLGQFRDRQAAEDLKMRLGAEGFSAFISGPIQ